MADFASILKFLKDLAKSNDRKWFEKNKTKYLDTKTGFDEFLADLLVELAKFDESIATLNPKKLAFRIYRDVRFSKDKSPYKVNMGAGISPAGKLIQEPGYYIHIEPGKSFVAGGIYMPDASNLAKIRQEIDYDTKGFLKVLHDSKFKKLFSKLDDFDKLKTAPKGFPKDHPHLELLKHKSYIVSHPLTDIEVKDKKFIKTIAGACRTLKPLNDFLKNALH
ncbi:MAG: DUF2461 domain-containing protein [Bacteroidia bacterium]|nr:DUF2461 domain-containing protein [Bacteroidia bacterium]